MLGWLLCCTHSSEISRNSAGIQPEFQANTGVAESIRTPLARPLGKGVLIDSALAAFPCCGIVHSPLVTFAHCTWNNSSTINASQLDEVGPFFSFPLKSLRPELPLALLGACKTTLQWGVGGLFDAVQ